MSLVIYPEVQKSYSQQGTRPVIQYVTNVRKAFLGVYYLIPIVVKKTIISQDLTQAAEAEALQTIHEEAYKNLVIRTMTSLHIGGDKYATVRDENQESEASRLNTSLGSGVLPEEKLELNAEGEVRPVAEAAPKPATKKATPRKNKLEKA